MNYKQFEESLTDPHPGERLSLPLKALWYDRKGDWNKAHELVQDLNGKSAARIHAYLHRKEGDIFNADYWYRRAAATRPNVSLEEEWIQLVGEFLTRD
ncbi:hypothetical protein [Hufsiella ginkgonis]|uniref:Uncharacterized protein n=1 Tax=Hufsiella ginkgonis TaxID=2695274 RepID=A0A7K1Y4E8_9SPHI|nr:hypothetical protein [Hufsiella ginkgonis]MXV17737.1 hypothetical protein [Hufsiella ginkgonis]